MKKHYIIMFVIAAACSACCLPVKADDEAEQGIWVAVSLFDGLSNRASEYYGFMPMNQYHGITKSTMTNGFFRLSNTVWMDDQGINLMRDSKLSGRLHGYSGEVHFLIHAITRISVLDPDYVKSTILPALKKSK